MPARRACAATFFVGEIGEQERDRLADAAPVRQRERPKIIVRRRKHLAERGHVIELEDRVAVGLRAVALGACVAAGLAGSSLWPSMLGASADRFPQGGATMFALLAALGNAGGVFMPWAIGVAADRWTLRAGLAMSAVCPLLMALLLSRLSHPRSGGHPLKL